MSYEEMYSVVERMIFEQTKRPLKNIEIAILKGSYEGKKYVEIADNYCCTSEYISHDAAPKFWRLLSEAMNEKVNKRNFRSIIESFDYQQQRQNHQEIDSFELSLSVKKEVSLTDVLELVEYLTLKLNQLEQKVAIIQSLLNFSTAHQTA